MGIEKSIRRAVKEKAGLRKIPRHQSGLNSAERKDRFAQKEARKGRLFCPWGKNGRARGGYGFQADVARRNGSFRRKKKG